jgi:hypothetical protein
MKALLCVLNFIIKFKNKQKIYLFFFKKITISKRIYKMETDEGNVGEISMGTDEGNEGEISMGTDEGNEGEISMGADEGNEGEISIGTDEGNNLNNPNASKSRGKEHTRRKLHTIHPKARRALRTPGIKGELKHFKKRTGLTDDDILDRVSVTASHIAESPSKVEKVHNLMRTAKDVGQVISVAATAVTAAQKVYDVVGPIIALALAL